MSKSIEPHSDLGPGRVVAIAGRRPDPEGGAIRFPVAAEGVVATRLDEWFRAKRPALVVSGAAAGVDILALEAAFRLGIPFRIVLTFDTATYRNLSVVDRGIQWGPRFDHLVSLAESSKNLVLMHLSPNAPEVYLEGNHGILEEAARIAEGHEAVTLVVWDGVSRGSGDATAHFAEQGKERGFGSDSLSTLP